MGIFDLLKEHIKWCYSFIQQNTYLTNRVDEIVSRSTKVYSDEELDEIRDRLSNSAHRSYRAEKLRRELAIGRKYLASGEYFSDEINMFAVSFFDFIVGIGILKEGDSGYYRYSVCYCDPNDTEKRLWNDRFARSILSYRLLSSMSDGGGHVDISNMTNRVRFNEQSDTNMVRFVLYMLMMNALSATGGTMVVPVFFRKRVSTIGFVDQGVSITQFYTGRKRKQEKRERMVDEEEGCIT